jgi:hypothetical protein
MNKRTLTISMMVVGGLLAPAVCAKGGSEGTCSNRTIKGQYAGSVEGVFLPAPGITLPISGVGITNYDGDGNLNEYGGYLVVNGGPPSEGGGGRDFGTYHINADCTGTAHILLDPVGGFFINLALVVTSNGKEIYSVITGPYAGPVIMSSFVYKRL